jgi:hypothetical protein
MWWNVFPLPHRIISIISNIWPVADNEIKDTKYLRLLKLFGEAVGMHNPKCGGMYFTAGYEAPTVILFDEKNQFTRELFDGLEGAY